MTQKQSPRGGQPPSANAASTAEPAGQEHLREGKDFSKQLTICDKNFQLYPQFGQVAQRSLQSFHEAATTFLDAAGTVALDISQNKLSYGEQVLYYEEERGRSIAFRLYKDGVRQLLFQPGVEREELSDFVECLRDARNVDEDQEDFTTLFWEKDSNHIQVQVVDDIVAADDLPPVPSREAGLSKMRFDRFRVPQEEEHRLREVMEKKKADEGDSTFEISEEESAGIREMVQKEESYFALLDFVDIMLELMVQNLDARAFSRSVKMIRTIIAALIEDRDFSTAGFLVEKFSGGAHPGLTDTHQRQIREMLASFTDKQTLHILKIYLEENQKLAKDHAIFKFMKTYSPAAAEYFCEFVPIRQHVDALTEVLAHLGAGNPDVFSKYLDHSDAGVVRAMVDIVLKVDRAGALARIAHVLKHPAESARIYVAKKMVEHGDKSIGLSLLPLLDEESRQLLNLALQFFAKTSVPEAYRRLQVLTASRTFQNLDEKRQRLCFKALLRASPVKALEFIQQSVLRWGFCFREDSRRKKAAALRALAFGPPRESTEILEKFAGKKRGRLAPVAQQALREMKMARKASAKVESSREKVTAEVKGG